MSNFEIYRGEFFATVCALSWAIGVLFFRMAGHALSASALTFFKNTLTFLVLSIWLTLRGGWQVQATPLEYGLLALSGVLGLGISDTLVFKCLQLLGAGRCAIVTTIYSPTVFLFGALLLGERFSWVDLAGGGLVLAAVLMIAWEKPGAEEARHGPLTRRDLILGVAYGVVAMVAVSLAIVIAKPILVHKPVLWVTNIRMVAGLGAVVLLSLLGRKAQEGHLLSAFTRRDLWRFTFPGAFFECLVAMPLWIAGMKFTRVGSAAILNQLSTVFMVALAAIFLREKIGLTRLCALILATLGAILVVL